MTTINKMDGGTVEVAPVAFLISRGPHVDDHRVAGPGDTRLAVGDRWPGSTTDRGMTATVEVHADGVKVALAYRVDRWSDREWAAYAAMPTIVSVLATPPLAWMLIEAHGAHARAPVALDLAPATRLLLHALLARPQSLTNELTLFGVKGDVIHSVKVGLALGGVWRLLAEAVAATPSSLSEREILDALERYAAIDAGIMFAAAMQRQLEPRAR